MVNHQSTEELLATKLREQASWVLRQMENRLIVDPALTQLAQTTVDQLDRYLTLHRIRRQDA